MCATVRWSDYLQATNIEADGAKITLGSSTCDLPTLSESDVPVCHFLIKVLNTTEHPIGCVGMNQHDVSKGRHVQEGLLGLRVKKSGNPAGLAGNGCSFIPKLQDSSHRPNHGKTPPGKGPPFFVESNNLDDHPSTVHPYSYRRLVDPSAERGLGARQRGAACRSAKWGRAKQALRIR